VRDDDGIPLARVEGIILVRFEEGMYFGNVGQLKERLKRIEFHGDLGIHPGETPSAPYATTAQGEWDDQTMAHLSLLAPRLYGVVFDMKAVTDIDARFDR
jgi:hypothetical protein